MENKKLFTVIIPIHNGEDTIERALASLISNKEYIYEVIIVDDRSSDNFKEKVEIFKNFFQIKIIPNAGEPGPGPARETGLLASRSEWITFLDADDEITASLLLYTYMAIQQDPNLVLIHYMTMFLEDGSFSTKDIQHFNNSCGGNFYRRTFLIYNNLHFHKTLYTAEDEYFNAKVSLFYENCIEDKTQFTVGTIDYVGYIVHHDNSERTSVTGKNWFEYVIDNHLFFREYIVKDMYDIIPLDKLEEFFFSGYMMAYFLFNIYKENENYNRDQGEELLREGLKFYCENFHKTKEDIIQYYNEHQLIVSQAKMSALSSIRESNLPTWVIDFDVFIKML